MTRTRWTVLGVTWLLAAVAAAQTPIAQQIAAQLTPNDLKADVSFLASDALEGRGTPSRGLDIAGEFIAAQFRRAGLEPAGNDGYFQSAPFARVTADTEGLQVTLEIAGRTIALDAAAIAIGDAAALNLQRAPVYLTSPATLAQLTADEVRGKVVIVDAPPGRTARLRQALLMRLGAALAIIQTTTPLPAAAAGQPRLREASTAVIPTVTVWDQSMRAALADIKAGPIEATLSAHIPAPKIEPVTQRNVIGLLRGADPALQSTYVLLTAHYDHLGVRGTGEGDRIFNGANDNASGTSSLIGIARALASLPVRPKRSIVFMALFGEELGLVGSRYYAQHPVFPLAKTVANLNLEHLGRTDENSGPRVGVLNATGFDYTDMPLALGVAGEELGIKLVKDEVNSDSFFARSDNQAFADAGIPSHTLSVGYLFPEYHQAGDEWQKIDYDNMAKIARTVALGVHRIADNAAAPKWNAENPKTAAYVKASLELRP
jgi:hypothetical protein